MDEFFDVYTKDKVKTDVAIRNGTPMAQGEYCLIVHAWVRNGDGRYLIARRAQRKTFGGLWECPGGGAIAGETSLDTALREIREEVGIALDPAAGKLVKTCVYDAIHAICDVWVFTHPVALETLTLATDEVTDARLASPQEILRLVDTGDFIPVYGYLEWFFDKEKGI